MDRRDVLKGVCLTGTTTFVVGCLGQYGGEPIVRTGSSAKSPGTNGTDTNGNENRQACEGGRPEWADDDPYEQYDVPGEDAHRGQYHVWIRNVTDETRSLEFAVSDGTDPILEESVDLPAGEYLELDVSGLEAVGLRLVSGDSRVETTVSQSGDAGSRSRTTITIHEGGIGTESETVQRSDSAVDVEETSFDTIERSCASGDVDGATVFLEDSTVIVEGRVETPTPCHALSLSEATVGDDGVLEVVVAVDAGEDEACVQCIGEVEYEARIDLTDTPGPVRVIHEVGDERRVAGSVVCDE